MINDWRILVVEDDPDGQDVVARILRYHKISLDIANDAEEALQLLIGGSQYTGAIIDLALPGIDGWTLLGAIRRDPQTANLPCVAVTAYHSAEVAVKAIEMGFNAYFAKPLETTSFVRELERVLRR
ncbi:MAG TPA: response regulator [Phototrophicaceae bacterium]|nr:response regulator [Phototrophicaceae bacterium]